MKSAKMLLLPVICLIVFFSGCNQDTQFGDISDYSSITALQLTALSNSGFYSTCYPDLDLSEINKLPVFKLPMIDCETRLKHLAEKLPIELFNELEPDKSRSNSYNDECGSFSIGFDQNCDWIYFRTPQECLTFFENIDLRLPEEFNMYYDNQTGNLILDEENLQILTEECKELAAQLRGDSFCLGRYSVRREGLWNDGNGTIRANYSVTVSYKSAYSETTRDELLDYYNLCDRIDFIFSFQHDEILDFQIKSYAVDNLLMVADYDIISMEKCINQFDDSINVFFAFDKIGEDIKFSADVESVKDYDIYIIYICDEENFIRPVYSKQDYRLVGNFFGAAWIDAIDY